LASTRLRQRWKWQWRRQRGLAPSSGFTGAELLDGNPAAWSNFAVSVSVHAVAGCASGAATGGGCGPGALSAAFSKAATAVTASYLDSKNLGDVTIGVTIHAVVGGTAAELGGGKFANGAQTGAFSYLFNELGSLTQRGYGYANAPYCQGSVCWPTASMDVTDYFGSPRPGYPHDGVDVRARRDAMVYSTQEGVIDRVDFGTRGGNQIYVRHADGGMAIYSHTAPLSGISIGQSVSLGQAIGRSDGSPNVVPHLHYIYKPPGSTTPVDPLTTQLAPFAGQWRYCGGGRC
jgi:murein DD-endopeptidase MepM/ murein hydrolase activator NlpD